MPTVLDTRRLPPVDRIAVAAAFLEATAPCALSFDDDEQLGHCFTGWPLIGGAQIIDVEGSGLRMTRRTQHVRAAAPERLCLGLQFRGRGRSEHRGVVTLTPPGYLNIIDCTSESDYAWTGLATRRVCLVEYATLGMPVDVVRASVGRLPASPLYDLVRSHLSGLRPEHEELRASPAGMRLAISTVELMRALVATAAESDLAREAHAHDILRTRIADFIERHLSDAELSAEAIARGLATKRLDAEIWVAPEKQ